MSGPGPFGEEGFGGLPFFGDISKLLGGQGKLNWDTARQLAMQIAASSDTGNIDPIVRMDVEALARVADLQVASVLGLPTSVTGSALQVVPVTRAQWVQRSLDAYKPLFEALAEALASARPGGQTGERAATGEDLDLPSGDPFGAMLNQLLGALAPAMLGMTAGGMLGHLANRSLGQYDLPLPRHRSDELMLVLPNVEEFGQEWSIDAADLRLWVCLHEIAHHAVLGVSHVRDELNRLVTAYAAGFRPDASALTDRLESLELNDPSDLSKIQSVFSDPEVLLGAVQSDEQRALLPRLETLVAVVVGVVDRAMDRVGNGLIGDYGRITEALRWRRVQADASDRFVERMFGLSLTQDVYDRGRLFAEGVAERAGDEGLEPLWRDVSMLPTPAELEAPGLWLARIEIPTDD